MSIRSAEPGDTAPSRSAASGIDAFAAKFYDELLLVSRVALGLIFVLSGYMKLTGLAAFSASLAARGVPAAWLWGPVGATVEFVGGLLIVLGLGTRYAALLMILFVIVEHGDFAPLLGIRRSAAVPYAAESVLKEPVHYRRLPVRVGGRRRPLLAGQAVAPLEHDPENACPGLDPGWMPVFGKDHAPPIS